MAQQMVNPGASTAPASMTDDAFLGGKLQILQPEKGYRAGIDAVFLAASIPTLPGEATFEVGLGAGVAALCMLARVKQAHVTGIEINTRYALLCEQNAKRNNFGNALRVIHADVKEALRRDLTTMPEHGSFAHAFANPPFYDEGKVTASPTLMKSRAHAFGPEDLELWVKLLHAMVAPRGTVTLIHRADSLSDILDAMRGKFGDIRIAPLFPRQGAPASRIIVQGIKASKAPLQILPGLNLHNQDNTFTPEAEAVLRGGAAWRLR
ncbi:tRNA1(Val) (adenine(37)-N6)-methyltransferase [Aestuariivirga litoralis]|uniref:tRNA1(Val) (adenine(37)-N6)-methyltransferase n=1 Tax=Aestuariivirga litoralis TaxID=2650924 RepID=UPI0018C51E97|nr:methyltransferase [Aestuariivirga litoralis]